MLNAKSWLRLFRVVNLPTVPGDVLVGAAAAMWGGHECMPELVPVAMFAAASCFQYLFGLVDNDIVGAATDSARPIPDGEISMRAAKVARGVCLALGILPVAAVWFVPLRSGLSPLIAVSSLPVAFALVAAIVSYNRTKRPLLMGLCRGLNVVLGVSAVLPLLMTLRVALRAPVRTAAVFAVALLWTAYIAAVTKYSEGEEADPARRRRVGTLIGGIVYMQLAALAAFAVLNPFTNRLLVAGAVLLLVLRLAKTALPGVSAS